MGLKAQSGGYATKKHHFCMWGLLLLLITLQAAAQTQPPEAQGGTIHGIVKSGNMPIPGAAVLISPASSAEQKPMSTWTDVDGTFSASVASYGTYTVRVQMAAFADKTQPIVIDASHQNVTANFELILASRSHEASPQARRPPARQLRNVDSRRCRRCKA